MGSTGWIEAQMVLLCGCRVVRARSEGRGGKSWEKGDSRFEGVDLILVYSTAVCGFRLFFFWVRLSCSHGKMIDTADTTTTGRTGNRFVEKVGCDRCGSSLFFLCVVGDPE